MAPRGADCCGPTGEFSPAVERAVEITTWLSTAKADHEAWVAIDDMDLAEGGPAHGVHASQFVHTDDEHGLTRAKAEDAVAKLMAQGGGVNVS